MIIMIFLIFITVHTTYAPYEKNDFQNLDQTQPQSERVSQWVSEQHQRHPQRQATREHRSDQKLDDDLRNVAIKRHETVWFRKTAKTEGYKTQAKELDTVVQNLLIDFNKNPNLKFTDQESLKNAKTQIDVAIEQLAEKGWWSKNDRLEEDLYKIKNALNSAKILPKNLTIDLAQLKTNTPRISISSTPRSLQEGTDSENLNIYRSPRLDTASNLSSRRSGRSSDTDSESDNASIGSATSSIQSISREIKSIPVDIGTPQSRKVARDSISFAKPQDYINSSAFIKIKDGTYTIDPEKINDPKLKVLKQQLTDLESTKQTSIQNQAEIDQIRSEIKKHIREVTEQLRALLTNIKNPRFVEQEINDSKATTQSNKTIGDLAKDYQIKSEKMDIANAEYEQAQKIALKAQEAYMALKKQESTVRANDYEIQKLTDQINRLQDEYDKATGFFNSNKRGKIFEQQQDLRKQINQLENNKIMSLDNFTAQLKKLDAEKNRTANEAARAKANLATESSSFDVFQKNYNVAKLTATKNVTERQQNLSAKIDAIINYLETAPLKNPTKR